LEPFAAFLDRDEVALVSCCNVGHGGSRYSVAVLTADGIDWLNLDSVIDPTQDKGITGIAASAEHCFLAVPGAHERLISLDRQLRPVDVFSSAKARDLHSVSVHDGRLYYASSGSNEVLSIACVDGRFQGPEQAHVTCGSTAEDEIHLNSLLVNDGTSVMYTMFGVGPRSQVRNMGAVVDAHSGEALVAGLMDPHSLTRLPDGRLAFCESLRNSLCIVDPATREVSRVALRGYTRGIAHTGRHLLVGASHWRNRSRSGTQVRGVPKFLGAARHRHTKESHLFVLREDLSVAHSIDFSAYSSEIYDVAFLGRRFAPEAVFKQAAERRRDVQRVRWPRWMGQASPA
jgi:uncharacterized protein (TIGR03032 family)